MSALYRRSGTNNYYMRIVDAEGKTQQLSTGTRDRDEAERILKATEAKLATRTAYQKLIEVDRSTRSPRAKPGTPANEAERLFVLVTKARQWTDSLRALNERTWGEFQQRLREQDAALDRVRALCDDLMEATVALRRKP